MGLEEVIEEILEEADRHASEIEREADEKASEIEREAESDAEEIREAARNAAEKEVAALEKQELSSAKLEARMKKLQARKQLLAEAKDRAHEKLEELSGSERDDVIDALLDIADEEMPEGDVYVAEQDADTVKSRVGDRFAGTIDAVGGLQVEQSGVVLDLTLDSLLEDQWEESLSAVNEALFGG